MAAKSKSKSKTNKTAKAELSRTQKAAIMNLSDGFAFAARPKGANAEAIAINRKIDGLTRQIQAVAADIAGSSKAGRELYWSWFHNWKHPLKRKFTYRIKALDAQRSAFLSQRCIIEAKADILPAKTVSELRRKRCPMGSVPSELLRHDAAVFRIHFANEMLGEQMRLAA